MKYVMEDLGIRSELIDAREAGEYRYIGVFKIKGVRRY